jgi:hypothetical protein
VHGRGRLFDRFELWFVVKGEIFIGRCLLYSYPLWEDILFKCVSLLVTKLLRANETIAGLYKSTFVSRITRRMTAWFAARRKE